MKTSLPSPRRARALPRNISAHPDGYLVRVVRGGIRYQAFVSGGGKGEVRSEKEDGSHLTPHTSALERAVRLRDRFLLIHGAIKGRGPSQKAYSNTGLVGVSETVHWTKSRPHPCFLVSAHRNFRRRIYFGARRSRSEALQMAVALRSKQISHRATEAQRGALN